MAQNLEGVMQENPVTGNIANVLIIGRQYPLDQLSEAGVTFPERLSPRIAGIHFIFETVPGGVRVNEIDIARLGPGSGNEQYHWYNDQWGEIDLFHAAKQESRRDYIAWEPVTNGSPHPETQEQG
tara:strand:- start:474 stop:848 length:375 start_codon:yes stop_codon:yes gene_type:complete